MFDNEKMEIVKCGLSLLELGYLKKREGNISVRSFKTEEVFGITPHRIDYDKMSYEDIVICDFNRKIVEGKRRPSIELAMHLHIYRNRNDVNAIIHTHSLYSTVLAKANVSLPITGTLKKTIGDQVEVSEYADFGTEELARNVVKVLGKKHAAFISNHGLVVVSEDLKGAIGYCEIVEQCADKYILANSIVMN